MDGPTQQALDLTVGGNARLQGREVGPFWPNSVAFMFCSEVRFVDGKKTVAANPALWLESLAEAGAALKLRIVPREDPARDMMLAGFANGGSRLLVEAILPTGSSTCWEPWWEVTGDPNDPGPDRSIWTVTYFRVPNPPDSPERALPRIAADLGVALDALAEFVDRASPEEAMPGWADQFRGARSALDAQPQWQEGDPPPAGLLAPDALRLLHACRAAWVFGGMGSWNDGAYWGGAAAEGERLSAALFALLNEAVAAAANSSCAAG
jgi:hypothetical protein